MDPEESEKSQRPRTKLWEAPIFKGWAEEESWGEEVRKGWAEEDKEVRSVSRHRREMSDERR